MLANISVSPFWPAVPPPPDAVPPPPLPVVACVVTLPDAADVPPVPELVLEPIALVSLSPLHPASTSAADSPASIVIFITGSSCSQCTATSTAYATGAEE